MEPYKPAEHLCNWVMNDYPLYERFKAMVEVVRNEPHRIHHVANEAFNIATDAVKNAFDANEFEEEFKNLDNTRQAAKLLIQYAEAEAGQKLK